MTELRSVPEIAKAWDIDQAFLIGLVRAGDVAGYLIDDNVAIDLDELKGLDHDELSEFLNSQAPAPRKRRGQRRRITRSVQATVSVEDHEALKAVVVECGARSLLVWVRERLLEYAEQDIKVGPPRVEPWRDLSRSVTTEVTVDQLVVLKAAAERAGLQLSKWTRSVLQMSIQSPSPEEDADGER
jgi:hypothetical protein